jgi:ring-1,2-phenylacetyl-CoA epoxidase subunit PaaC
MQEALDMQWGYTQQLFVPLPDEEILVRENIVPDLNAVKTGWLEQVTRHLQASGFKLPLNIGYQPASRQIHTEHLWSLLAEMQSVARWDAEAKVW